jgi:serine/threonine protein kinase
MGVVYEAWDPHLQRAVALKLLISVDASDGDPARTLLQEGRAAAALNHPNVCAIYEVGAVGATPFIAMELVEGQTLRDLTAHGPLPHARVIRFGRDLSSALAAAHERGVIHRDLKSANVMVSADDRVRVLDFGIAERRSGATDETRTGTEPRFAGTLAYMAPELLEGREPSPQSDLWGLGIILYEMVTGLVPFTGASQAHTSAAILRDSPPVLPAGIPPGWCA